HSGWECMVDYFDLIEAQNNLDSLIILEAQNNLENIEAQNNHSFKLLILIQKVCVLDEFTTSVWEISSGRLLLYRGGKIHSFGREEKGKARIYGSSLVLKVVENA
ncbi:10418_t:CDS:2, partial [Funneliformis geosporum]